MRCRIEEDKILTITNILNEIFRTQSVSFQYYHIKEKEDEKVLA